MACSEPYPCGGVKSAWPELVGWNVGDAAAVIVKENPTVIRVVPLLHGRMKHPADFCCDRVRVWVDDSNIIVQVPILG